MPLALLILSCLVSPPPPRCSGGNIGSGMVRYSSTAEATAAIQGLNMLQLPGMDRPIEVKYAESRAEKDRRVANRMDNEEEDQVDPFK